MISRNIQCPIRSIGYIDRPIIHGGECVEKRQPSPSASAVATAAATLAMLRTVAADSTDL